MKLHCLRLPVATLILAACLLGIRASSDTPRAACINEPGRHDISGYVFQAGLDAGSDDAEQWDAFNRFYQTGIDYFASGMYEEAADIFTAIVEAGPDFAEPYQARALVYVYLYRFDDAIADLDRSIALGLNDAEMYAVRASVRLVNGNPHGAMLDCDRSLQLDPYLPDCFLTRATVHYDLGRFEQALADIDKAIELAPDTAEHHFSRGQIFNALGRQEQALAEFSKAVEFDPLHAEAEIFRQILVARSDASRKEALDSLTRSEKAEDRAQAYVDRAWEQYWWGNYDLAIEDLTTAISLAPRMQEAYEMRGVVYMDLLDLQRASEDFEKSLEIDPKSEAALLSIAELAYVEGNPERALEFTTAAVAEHPESAFSRSYHASMLAMNGNYTAALLAFETALELDPDDAWAYNDRALKVHIPTGDMDAALLDLTQALEILPNEAGIRHTLGYWHYLKGDLQEAYRTWQETCMAILPGEVISWQMHLKRLGHYSSTIDTVCDHRLFAAFRSCAEADCDF